MSYAVKTRSIPLAVAAALALAGAVLCAPAAVAAPDTAIGSVPRLSADQPDQATTIAAPGDSASLTTTFSTTKVASVTDIVFVLDTTGSMSFKLAAMSTGLSQFVQALADNGASDLAFGVYIFGDKDFGDAFQWDLPLTPLSSTFTASDVASKIQNATPTSGGWDSPEDALLAGTTVAATTPWRDGAQHEEILITDASSKVRTCPDFCVDGQAPTLTTFQADAAANDVHVTVVPASASYGTSSSTLTTLGDMATAFDSSTTPVSSAADYVDRLNSEVVLNPENDTPITVVPSLTVTYADGTTSHDVTAAVTPSGATAVAPGTPVPFTLTATAVSAGAVARPGAVSTVEVDYTVQGTSTLVARQVITFTAPTALQAVHVVYVDDDRDGATVTPVSGTATTLTGVSGASVGFAQAQAAAGIPDGYEFESLDNVATYDTDTTVDQTITVHLVHKHVAGTLDTTRTITYVGPEGYPIPDPVVQPLSWAVDTDEVTGVVIYTSTQDYAAVDTPVVTGLAPDAATVPEAQGSVQNAKPEDTQVTVTYTAVPAPVVQAGPSAAAGGSGFMVKGGLGGAVLMVVAVGIGFAIVRTRKVDMA